MCELQVQLLEDARRADSVPDREGLRGVAKELRAVGERRRSWEVQNEVDAEAAVHVPDDDRAAPPLHVSCRY